MPEQKMTFSRKEQEKLKPIIEDFATEHLDGDIRKMILDFVAHLRANGMPLKWTSTNGWSAKYKSQTICQIVLALGTFADDTVWWVTPDLTHLNEYEAVIMSKGLQDFIWDNVFYCAHDPKSPLAGKGCNPNKGCAPGKNCTILGREILGMCRNRPNPVAHDPDEAAIVSVKRLLELERQARDAEAAAKKKGGVSS